jgi:hypothetical protein
LQSCHPDSSPFLSRGTYSTGTRRAERNGPAGKFSASVIASLLEKFPGPSGRSRGLARSAPPVSIERRERGVGNDSAAPPGDDDDDDSSSSAVVAAAAPRPPLACPPPSRRLLRRSSSHHQQQQPQRCYRDAAKSSRGRDRAVSGGADLQRLSSARHPAAADAGSLARARGKDIAYRALAYRYRAMAKSLGFEGHIAIADAMT